ncbi:hypothetical protein PS2_007146 [Malus domestica]
MSNEFSSNTSTLSLDSVLHRPKLSTILFGKEAREIGNSKQIYSEEEPQKKVERRRRRKKKSESKSLTDLQFEELKGFIDLGFVFSEENKDSNLVSIIAKFRADEMAKANEFIRKQRQRDWEVAQLSLIEICKLQLVLQIRQIRPEIEPRKRFASSQGARVNGGGVPSAELVGCVLQVRNQARWCSAMAAIFVSETRESEEDK